MKMNKIGLLIIVILGVVSAVNGHGADVTNNVMVIADEATGVTVKKIVDELNLDITVYKFTSKSDISHQLEHVLTNPDKRILVVAFQDEGNEFLSEHKELSNQVIVVNDTDEESIKEGLIQLNSTINRNNNENTNNTNIDYTSLILVIVVVGLISAIGIIILKKKK